MKKIYLLLAGLLAVGTAHAQWVLQNTGFMAASRGIRDISIVSPQVAWAVAYDGSGANGNVQDYTRTINGGTNWTAGTITAPGITGFNNASISATTADSAWVALYGPAGGGRVYHTSNGGTSWTQQNTTGYTDAASFLNFVHFFDSENGVTMGDPVGGWHEVYTTSNAGATWTRVPITSMPAPISADEWGVVNLYSAVGNTIWFGTIFGRIYKSTDRGLTWTVHTTGFTGTTSAFAMNDVEFSDANNGLIRNGTAIRRTTDGGLTWSPVTYAGPLYTTDIGAVAGTAGSFVSVATGSSYTLNGGQNWIGINTGTQYNRVEFGSPTLGYAGGFSQAGGTGGIYKWAGPALVTTQDVGISAITSPNTQLCNATNQLVCVVIANTGNTPQSGFQVSYTLNGGTPVVETYAATLQPSATASYCFSTVANFAAAGSYTLTATTLLAGDTNPANNQATTTITSTVSPALTVSPATTICAGQSATLTVSGANTYVWQPGGLTGSSITVTPATTTTYTVTGSSGGTCNSTATTTVTVSAGPAVAATATPASICAGETSLLEATGANTYVWSPGSTTGSTLSVSPTATTTYSVTGTDANGCTAAAGVTVAVTTGTSVSIAPVAAICEGQTATLVASGAATYTWQPGGQTGASLSVTPTATTTYTVTGSSGSGCSGMAMATVTVNPAPIAPTAGSNSPICEGSDLSLSAIGNFPPSGTYSWIGCNGFTSSTQNPTISAVTAANACDYTVFFIDANGCSSIGATTTVVVYPMALPPAINPPTPICEGQTLNLSVTNPQAGAAYSWSGCGGFTSNNPYNAIPNVTLAQACTYTLTVTHANGCQSAPATITPVINPAPVVTLTSNSPVCQGETLTMTASHSGSGATYSWFNAGTFTSSNQIVNIPNAQPSDSGGYIGHVSQYGCIGEGTITVVVNPAPAAAITHTATGTTVNLTASGAGTYSWTATGGTLSSATAATTTVTYPATGTYTVSLTVTANGCSTTTTEVISVISGVANSLSSLTQVFPNPTAGQLLIKIPEEIAGTTTRLSVYNALGQQVMAPAARAGQELIELNLAGLAEGAYLLQIETSLGTIRKQVLLQK